MAARDANRNPRIYWKWKKRKRKLEIFLEIPWNAKGHAQKTGTEKSTSELSISYVRKETGLSGILKEGQEPKEALKKAQYRPKSLTMVPRKRRVAEINKQGKMLPRNPNPNPRGRKSRTWYTKDAHGDIAPFQIRVTWDERISKLPNCSKLYSVLRSKMEGKLLTMRVYDRPLMTKKRRNYLINYKLGNIYVHVHKEKPKKDTSEDTTSAKLVQRNQGTHRGWKGRIKQGRGTATQWGKAGKPGDLENDIQEENDAPIMEKSFKY